MNLGTIFMSEAVGSAILIILGAGVVANNLLDKSKGHGAGHLHITWGWGIAVFAGVLASYKSGGHINPAVTLGVIASGATEFVPGVPVDAASTFTYIGGQLVGAFIGAVICWLAYKKQFDADAPEGFKLGVFSTGPEVRSYGWNVVTEAIGTFVLVFIVLAAGKFTGNNPTPAANLGWLGALGVALLVLGIGISLGGPTGYAINPTRDLGPRLAHAVLPIPNKGSSDWSYAWVPVVGPIIGGVIAGLASQVLLPAV